MCPVETAGIDSGPEAGEHLDVGATVADCAVVH